ncbi:unnamed protein product [Vicia faba]|uniref:Uncharacterized protein n=1 Tax=Vicia faba TaxID=3906 RepID=A0AAV0Z678_VICFA|nr:unnamed protein product [Vicia faba]
MCIQLILIFSLNVKKKAYLVFELEDGTVEEVEEETLFKEVSRRILEEQTPEEISKIIDMCKNITKEEKLEPDVNKIIDDPRMRLLTKLHAKKLNELKKKFKDDEVVKESKEEPSVDELLSFINGNEGGDTKEARKNKKKKKNKRRKENTKSHSSKNANEDYNESSTSQDHATSPKEELSEDDLDPVLKEKLDREVEEFARILNLGWSERVKMFT